MDDNTNIIWAIIMALKWKVDIDKYNMNNV